MIIYKPKKKDPRIITPTEAKKLYDHYRTQETGVIIRENLGKINLRYGDIYIIGDEK